MNRKVALSAVASTLLSLSSAALADNLSGAYVGGNLALSDSFSAKFAEPSGITSNLSATETLSSADLTVGYQQVTDSSLFYGVEGFYTFGGAKDDTLTDGTTTIEVEKENGFGVKGKLGLALNGNSAVYGLLGYSRVEAKLTASTDNTDASDSDDFDGYSVGVGGIYGISENLLLTVEGTFSDYDKQDYSTFSIDPEETRVTFGLAYRFDI